MTKRVPQMIFAFTFLFVLGCSTPPGKSSNSATNCEEDARPSCLCGEATCSDGQWGCGPCDSNNTNQQNNTSCADPAPSCQCATCSDGQWSCESSCDDSKSCADPKPSCLCGTSTCQSGSWTCVGECGQECEQQGESNLTGVRIEFEAVQCEWTLSEVAAGIEIPYTVVIDEAITVTPRGQATCAESGPGDLKIFFRIEGDAQLYCLCDNGLCPTDEEEIELMPGEYDGVIAWDGVNWTGPSDTGNPPGDPFGPGDYRVELSAAGEVQGDEYEVRATMPITLRDDL